MGEPRNIIESFALALYNIVDTPVTFFREKIVEPNQKPNPWYHRKFRRVPTVDECYSDDFVCIYEADQQYRRDRMVDSEILSIVRDRAMECRFYHDPDRQLCIPLQEAYEVAATNWFSKHGDMGITANAKNSLMRQKHRMVWERRHGPIGSGMKE